MNKGDAILRLLSEIKLELKEVKEQVEQMQIKLDTFKPQNQVKCKCQHKHGSFPGQSHEKILSRCYIHAILKEKCKDRWNHETFYGDNSN
ncbi:hypothetical protein [Bacillus thuringiensis]|uniref:hypothetical protein n=1 Tax=Bacillus thuringiensis TaxID=1428 RepID=UPI003B983962